MSLEDGLKSSEEGKDRGIEVLESCYREDGSKTERRKREERRVATTLKLKVAYIVFGGH